MGNRNSSSKESTSTFFDTFGHKFGKHATAKDVIDGHGVGNYLAGKTAIVTGGNSGLGLETCKALAFAGARVIMCSRTMKSGGEAILREMLNTGVGGYKLENADNIAIRTLDLENLESIQRFCLEIIANEIRIDFLILNAGIMALPTLELTPSGFEKQIGINHFGHFYLTKLLVPKMKVQLFKSRIIVVGSIFYKYGKIHISDLHFTNRKYRPWAAYGQSKLANMLFARCLAEQLLDTSVTVVALHPGVVNTNLTRFIIPNDRSLKKNIFEALMVNKTIPEGAATTLWAALAPQIEVMSGSFLENCALHTIRGRYAQDESGELRAALWRTTDSQLSEALAALERTKLARITSFDDVMI